jgi:hypothetical protein
MSPPTKRGGDDDDDVDDDVGVVVTVVHGNATTTSKRPRVVTDGVAATTTDDGTDLSLSEGDDLSVEAFETRSPGETTTTTTTTTTTMMMVGTTSTGVEMAGQGRAGSASARGFARHGRRRTQRGPTRHAETGSQGVVLCDAWVRGERAGGVRYGVVSRRKLGHGFGRLGKRSRRARNARHCTRSGHTGV